jgi:acyl carrier protein
MVPAELLFVDELPRTPNGKLDRKALLEPAHEDKAPTGRRPPETVPERELAAIWGRVLAVGDVGRDDDFFDLGGHSLAVLQVVAAISASFGVDVAPDLIFDAPTLGEFAAAVGVTDLAAPSPSGKAL